MQRTLVWPWHGRVQNGSVYLADGTTKPYVSLPTSVYEAFGPGDNHRIVVPGVDPLTEEEKARTPTGGTYWAGRALVAAGTLYGRQVGWIYQADDGSRWAVNFVSRLVAASSSSFELAFTRFGEWGVPEEVVSRQFNVAIGQLSVQDRARYFFASLGGVGNASLRLHALSDTGKTSVLSWVAFNNQGSASIDPLPRVYAFLKLSITGSGEGILVEQELLYGPSEVRKDGDLPELTYYSIQSTWSSLVEKDRQPLLDENGVRVGSTVTYEFGNDVVLAPQPNSGPQNFPGPLVYTREQSWIVSVALIGEEPVPCYLKCTETGFRSMVSLQFVTDTDRIQREFDSGAIDIVQMGTGHVSGGGGSSGTLTASWESAGAAWRRSISFETVSQVEGELVTNLQTFDGVARTFLNAGYGAVGQIGDGSFFSDEAGKPMISGGLGTESAQWKFDLYSNNATAVSYRRNSDAFQFEGALTLDGLIQQAGAYPSAVLSYGSYNPFSQQLVLGSSVPVNWV